MKCKKKENKVTGRGRLCLGLASAHSQGSVPVRSWLHSVGQLECVPGRAAQIRDAVMLLWDAVEVWQSRGQAGPDRGQTEARGKDQGQEPTHRVEPLCRIPAL